MIVVYLSHPVSAPTAQGIADNLARAKRWLKWLLKVHPECSPVASWIPMVEVEDNSDPARIEHSLRLDFEVVSRCDEIWLVGGRISSGMRREADHARAHNVRVIDLTPMGDEPPPHDYRWADDWRDRLNHLHREDA